MPSEDEVTECKCFDSLVCGVNYMFFSSRMRGQAGLGFGIALAWSTGEVEESLQSCKGFSEGCIEEY